MKNLQQLYAFIYGCGEDAVFCEHCGRPLKIEIHNGEKMLVCHRCMELQREARQEMEDNVKVHEARARRLKKHG